MTRREPVAFISYVRSDDDHDSGRITELRQRLEGEVKMQTGQPFHIFQDRNDIKWGQQWKERIEDSLHEVTFLIPIVTPSYFKSNACIKEFDTFHDRENTLGENRLILPIYYVSCDEMEDGFDPDHAIAKVLRTRNWADWRGFRFEALSSGPLRAQIAALAATIKGTMRELEAIFAASRLSSSTVVEPIVSIELPRSEYAKSISFSPKIPTILSKGAKRFDKIAYENAIKSEYYAYTSNFDEIIASSQLLAPEGAMQLHASLLGLVRRETSNYELELAAATVELARAAKGDEIAISFLIDNSGSMRGEKIAGVATGASISARILEQSGIQSEVLGFTTRAWKGGQSRDQWIKDGKPDNPGRLNDIRHIVYKNFDETFQESDINFGLMLREGLLKENIDGEALLWARSRLLGRSEKRKIIFMLSDGAPVDDSTLSVNEANFLHNHLMSVIGWIRNQPGVELYGLGIEFDVDRYYGSGSPILDARRISPDLLRSSALAIANNWAEAGSIRSRRVAYEAKAKMARPARKRSAELPPKLLE